MRETAATRGSSTGSQEQPSNERTLAEEQVSPEPTTDTSGAAVDATATGEQAAEPTSTEPVDPVEAAGVPGSGRSGPDPAAAAAGDTAADTTATGELTAASRAGASNGSSPSVLEPAEVTRPSSAPIGKPVSFSRPAGMVPPPDRPANHDGQGTDRLTSGRPSGARAWTGASGGFPTISAPARLTATTGAGLTGRPIGSTETGTGARSSSEAVGAARVGEPVRPRVATAPRGPRRARLNVKRVDPWSVMKFSFAVSLVLFIVVIVASAVLYLALDTMGVFASINSTVAELVSSGAGESGFQITAQGVIGTSAVLGALNVLLFTSLATLGAFIYNVCADLVGGVELTLAERD